MKVKKKTPTFSDKWKLREFIARRPALRNATRWESGYSGRKPLEMEWKCISIGNGKYNIIVCVYSVFPSYIFRWRRVEYRTPTLWSAGGGERGSVKKQSKSPNQLGIPRSWKFSSGVMPWCRVNSNWVFLMLNNLTNKTISASYSQTLHVGHLISTSCC